MSEYIHLYNTAKLRNVVDLFLCSALYKVCNGIQFNPMKGTDFANFLNLQETSEPVVVLKAENRRVCYLINMISKHLLDRTVADDWIKSMLERCNISYKYYRSHYSEVGSATAAKPDKSFAENVQNAIKMVAPYL